MITKNIGKVEKKKWRPRGDPTETIGVYKRLGLLERVLRKLRPLNLPLNLTENSVERVGQKII